MKKILLAIFVGTLCLIAPSAYAQRNLIKGMLEASSKASAQAERQLARSAALGAQLERQVARATLGAQLGKQLPTQNNALYTRTLYHRRGTPSPEYNGLLTRITLAETLPGEPRPIKHVAKLPTILSSREFAFTYVPQAPELQLLQDYVKEYNRWPIVGNYPEVLYAFISLVQQDVAGKLSIEDQQQLYKLAMLRYFHDRSMVDSISELKAELSYWKQKYGTDANPKLVPKEQLMDRYYFELFAKEWYLAAHIYLAQQIYGDQLPKILQEVNVIPEPTH